MNKTVKIILFLAVLIFTFVLRTHNYDRVPETGHLEEMAYAWAGIYMIETGTPVSWSSFEKYYPKRSEVFRGVVKLGDGPIQAGVALFKPWLDEPPLFSLLIGWSAYLFHADRSQIISSAYLRLPMIFIATLSSILIFLIGRKVSGYKTGLLAMLFFGTIPLMVLASRMAIAENAISLLFLTIIYLLLHFLDRHQIKYLIAIPILIGIAGLCKPTGFFILPFVVYVLLMQKTYRASVSVVLGTLPFIGAFIAYGLYYDAEIFWLLTGLQSFRPVGFNSLGWILVSPAYDHFQFIDSWYIFFMLSSFYFVFRNHDLKNTGQKLLVLAFVYWILVVMVSGGEGDLLPWYRIPAFGLMAILGTWGIQYLVEKSNIYTTFLAAGMLLGGRHFLVNAFHPNISPLAYRLSMVGLMAPALWNNLWPNDALQKICRIIIIGIIVVGVYWNSLYIYNVFEIKCEGVDCSWGPTISLSTIHLPILWRLMVL